MNNKEIKSPNEVVVESSTGVQSTESKPKKRIGLVIMLVILGLLLVGGALALGYLWGNNNPKTATQDNQTMASDPNPNPVEATSSTDNKTDTPAEAVIDTNVISVAEAEKILEKYIGQKNSTVAFPLNDHYNIFISDFDNLQKVFLAYKSIDYSSKNSVNCTSERYERGSCTGKSISYDIMNEKYQSLFGDYGSIEKKDYAFYDYFYLVYDDSIGAYREYVLPGGGSTTTVAAHKIISVDKNNNDMVVSIAFVELPPMITDETLDKTVDSMAVYEFTLSPYSNTYVLTSIEKMNQ